MLRCIDRTDRLILSKSYWALLFGCAACVVLASNSASAQLEFEAEPINYNTAPTSDRVRALADRIEQGDSNLEHDDQYGYLKAVLEHLDVPISSQMLVFSKTSFQLRRISKHRPRAVYFNDDVYVGWVQGGDVVELSQRIRSKGRFSTRSAKRNRTSPRSYGSRTVYRLPCIIAHVWRARSSGPLRIRRQLGPAIFWVGHVYDRSSQSIQGALGRLVRIGITRRTTAHGKCRGNEHRPPREIRR